MADSQFQKYAFTRFARSCVSLRGWRPLYTPRLILEIIFRHFALLGREEGIFAVTQNHYVQSDKEKTKRSEAVKTDF